MIFGPPADAAVPPPCPPTPAPLAVVPSGAPPRPGDLCRVRTLCSALLMRLSTAELERCRLFAEDGDDEDVDGVLLLLLPSEAARREVATEKLRRDAEMPSATRMRSGLAAAVVPPRESAAWSGFRIMAVVGARYTLTAPEVAACGMGDELSACNVGVSAFVEGSPQVVLRWWIFLVLSSLEV